MATLRPLCWAVLVAALLLGLGGCAAGHGQAVPPAATSASSPSTAASSSAAAADVPLFSIRVSPQSGPPGTVVTITGDAPVADLPPRLRPSHATACWASCRTGWTQGAIPLQWSSTNPGAFTLQMQVPEVPWVSVDGVRPLVLGTYRIGVRCVLPGAGCASRPAEASASFRLTGPVPRTCTAGQPCGRLVLTPDRGPPGTLVQISGWAPLGQWIGTPFGFYVALEQSGHSSSGLGYRVQQRVNGDLYGSFVLPPHLAGIGNLAPGPLTLSAFSFYSRTHSVSVARAAFRVETAPSWASLGTLRPELVQQAMPGNSASDGNRLARCLPGGNIDLSDDGGRRWSTVPTAGVAAALKGTPYSVTWGDVSTAKPPACATVALQPGGGAIFAAFGGVANGTAPPVFWFPLVTRDGGRTWHLLPGPAGYKPSAFSRFQVEGTAVLALYWDGPKAEFGLAQSTDGGQTWTPGRLACPSTGPCVTWGPAPDWTWPGIGNCQAVLRSSDEGATWAVSNSVCYTGTGPVGPYALAALPDGSVVLLGGAAYPVQMSTDGGRTWIAARVPRLPGQSATAWYPPVRLLADGTLATRWNGRVWWALSPGEAAWCPTSRPASQPLPGGTLLRCPVAAAAKP